MALSAILWAAGKKEAASFVGQWAATILIMGVYNQLVKQLGSDGDIRSEASSEPQNRGAFAAGA
jgi:hypothetical protein